VKKILAGLREKNGAAASPAKIFFIRQGGMDKGVETK
jgi:hypothetical protein